MATGMSNGKVERIGVSYTLRLGEGWEFEDDTEQEYDYGAVIARRGELKCALSVDWSPTLRVSIGGGEEDILRLPDMQVDKVGSLAANIAWVISRALERNAPPKEESVPLSLEQQCEEEDRKTREMFERMEEKGYLDEKYLNAGTKKKKEEEPKEESGAERPDWSGMGMLDAVMVLMRERDKWAETLDHAPSEKEILEWNEAYKKRTGYPF